MDTGAYADAVALLPEDISAAARSRCASRAEEAEELRLRLGLEATVLFPEEEQALLRGRFVTERDLDLVLERATRASLHAAADSLRQGYVTTRTGCRVGVCGTAATEDGRVSALRRFSSLCIRIPRQCRGCADGVFARLRRAEAGSTLIISPPGGGKTTLLRELVRLYSEAGARVSLADERGEIAAACEGRPRFDLGPRTDVMTGGTKAETALMLLRSMNPQILAMDEITAPEDAAACRAACGCGVTLLATAHASGVEELKERPLYRTLLDERIFRRAIVIRRGESGRVTELRALP